MAQEVIKTSGHQIIGSGRMTHINDFIRDLYNYFGKSYDDLVVENLGSFKEYEIKYEYYLKTLRPCYSYIDLLNDTINDIETKINDK